MGGPRLLAPASVEPPLGAELSAEASAAGAAPPVTPTVPAVAAEGEDPPPVGDGWPVLQATRPARASREAASRNEEGVRKVGSTTRNGHFLRGLRQGSLRHHANPLPGRTILC